MTVASLFDAIESKEFAATANLASSARGFIEAIVSSGSFTSLLKEAKENTGVRSAILERVAFLDSLDVDYRYENPHDVALATYAWALLQIHRDFAEMAASILIGTRQVWWARFVAQHILERERESKTIRGTNTQEGQSDFSSPYLGAVLRKLDEPTPVLPARAFAGRVIEGTKLFRDSRAVEICTDVTWDELAELRQRVRLGSGSGSSQASVHWQAGNA